MSNTCQAQEESIKSLTQPSLSVRNVASKLETVVLLC